MFHYLGHTSIVAIQIHVFVSLSPYSPESNKPFRLFSAVIKTFVSPWALTFLILFYNPLPSSVCIWADASFYPFLEMPFY